MKKIMKKVFSLALALVLFALTPMTTQAEISFGEGTVYSPYMMDTMADTTPVLGFGEPVVFACQVAEAGTYSVTVEGENTLIVGAVDIMNEVLDEVTAVRGSGTVTKDIDSVTNRRGQNFVYFYIVNLNNAGTGIYDISIEKGEATSTGEVTGDGTEANPYDITAVLETPNTPAVGHMQSAFYKITDLVAGGKYELNFSCPAVMGGINAYSVTSGDVTAESSNYGTIDATITLDASDAGVIEFEIASLYAECGPFTVTVKELPLGSSGNPDELVLDAYKEVRLVADNDYIYYYVFETEEEGYLTIELPEMFNTYNWEYCIYEANWSDGFEGKYCVASWADDEYEDTVCENPVTVGVKADEVVMIYFEILDEETEAPIPGTVFYKATFVEDVVDREVEVPDFVEDTADDVTDSILATNPIDVGTNDVKVSMFYSTTLYDFCPLEPGVYTISVSDANAKLGLWGYNMSSLSNPNATSNTVEGVTITAIGQSAYIGLTGCWDSETVITVTKTGDVSGGGSTGSEYVDVEHEGEALEEFVFEGDVDNLEYVDVEDDVINTAVLGEDGFYHLNSATGPILLINLGGQYGSINPLVSAENGALKVIDAEGNRWNYSALYLEYKEVADDETVLYPLTAELIELYKEAGKAQGWYMAALGGVETEDGWMFNLCYDPATDTTPEDVPGEVAPGGTDTSDSTNFALWIAVLGLGVVAIAGSVVMKKREF